MDIRFFCFVAHFRLARTQAHYLRVINGTQITMYVMFII